MGMAGGAGTRRPEGAVGGAPSHAHRQPSSGGGARRRPEGAVPRLPAGAGMTDEMGRAAWRGRISTNIDRNEARLASLKSGGSQLFNAAGLGI